MTLWETQLPEIAPQTPRAIQAASIKVDLRSPKNWQEVEKNPQNVGNVKTLPNEKVKQKKVLQHDGVSFKAIKELKAYVDFQASFLIHIINESQQSIFKTSTSPMKLALEIDFEGDHFLKDEYCHSDGNHKRVRESVTLTASVYHPLEGVCHAESHLLSPSSTKTACSCNNELQTRR